MTKTRIMRGPKWWFSTLPAVDIYKGGELWDSVPRRHPWRYEHSGSRFRIIVGDLRAEMEHETDSPAGINFVFDLSLCQEDIPEFYLENNPKAVYDIHSLTVMFWRWGIYLSIRGQVR